MKSLKMTLLFILLYFPFNYLLIAQEFNGLAKYKVRLAEDKFDFDASLFFNQKFSKFIYKENDKKKWVVDSDDPMGPIQVVYTDDQGYIVWRSILDPNMYVREFCGSERPEVYLDPIKFDWTLVKEEKEVAGLSCQKATTSFRGREYTVWYTTSIPISVGPWKFNGLPGLIVSVTDNKNDVHIRLVDLNLSASIPDLSNPFQNTTITREKFIECLDSEYEKYYRRNQAIIAQLQAQAQADGDDIEISDGGLSKERKSTELN